MLVGTNSSSCFGALLFIAYSVAGSRMCSILLYMNNFLGGGQIAKQIMRLCIHKVAEFSTIQIHECSLEVHIINASFDLKSIEVYICHDHRPSPMPNIYEKKHSIYKQ